ncbi:MAG: hypothetical protein JXQ75_11860 [Phycisphaerae bacterium]|nr:hypothetical protein [Phycisphaerae bacterium]
MEIIRIYGLRFKIEVSFKQSLRVIGTLRNRPSRLGRDLALRHRDK